jgi:prepilin-type N-terminal cleavage/methylation domain-containing protein
MNPRSICRRAAFTLVELLVVIAIIAILAALLFPIIGKVVAQGDSTKCLQNLKQIGVAISTYAADNNDTLPGPLTLTQTPTFKAGDTGSLPQLLASYLNLVENASNVNVVTANDKNVFVCPAYKRRFPTLNGVVYAMNMRQVQAYKQAPWGDSTTKQTPLRRGILSSWTEDNNIGADTPVELAQTFAMRDTDQLDTQYGGATASSTAAMAPYPFHAMSATDTSGHRNALYYDMHVAEMKLTDQTKNWQPGTNPQ